MAHFNLLPTVFSFYLLIIFGLVSLATAQTPPVFLGTWTPASDQAQTHPQRETITFTNHDVRAFAGCNRFDMNVNALSEEILLKSFTATRMLCTDMRDEQFFYSILRQITKFKVVNNKLLLEDKDAKVIAEWTRVPP